MFTPVSRSRASGEIVSQIEHAIFEGGLRPGDRLESERELAEQFGVSRITVRDALRVLEARGLIRVKVGASGGAFVAETNLDQVAESITTMVRLRRMTLSELAEARTIVESAAAERAAARADDAAVARLGVMVEEMRHVVHDERPHTEASMDFHVAVAEASGNELLSATVRAYRDLLMQTLQDMRDVRSARVTQKWHEEIMEAIRAHDADAARKLMQDHLQDFEKRIRLYLQTKDVTGEAKADLPALAGTSSEHGLRRNGQ
ncbi:MAG: FadR family transcriptional regulator [Chloroflexota bacterium]|nr:FadR family transcriptional regulator [Chloroflexota bacterium]MDE3193081.1 FadR family transcriptional regulator [Chloroflexota bacterium]